MKKAFSLVELSIVLVILGLLVGGVLSGQSLIHAAQLRSISGDYQRYMAAMQTFRDKYFAIPGDMTNATAFWGSAGGTGSDSICQATLGTGTQTCNGDGDGTLMFQGFINDEPFRFWQHLANAGLIEGSYTGVAISATQAKPGTNIPVSKYSSAAFFYATMAPSYSLTGSTYYAGSIGQFAAEYGKVSFYFGTYTSPSCTTSNPCVLKPEDAWNIDTKMDDGMPGTGSIMSNKGNAASRASPASSCTTAANVAPPGDAGATYNLSITTPDCALIFPRIN